MTTYTDANLEDLSRWSADELKASSRRWQQARGAGALVQSTIGVGVIRHAEVCEALRDRRLRGMGMDLDRMAGIPEDSRTWRSHQNFPLFMDGEDHRRLRGLVAKAFTPRAVETLRPFARSVIGGLVDSVFAVGRCDAVPTLCNPFPIPVICALIGIEPDRVDDVSRWARATVLSLRMDAAAFLDEIETAQDELDDYVDGLIVARRKAPRDDLLSRLIAAEEAGEGLSTIELRAVVGGMLVAGTDTTRNQLSNLIQTFATHANEWTLLRSQPQLVASAVEEAIRWQPAARATVRVALEDIEVGGLTVPAGSVVSVITMSGNHDEAMLPNADRFDIARSPPSGWQMLTFGGGIHYCLGASLARLELTEALAEFSARFGQLRLDGEPVPTSPELPFVGYQSLPIAWR
jgi:cytochrome P450